MAGKLTYVGSGYALDAALGRAAGTVRNMYLALLTGAASQSSIPTSIVEYATTGYARQLCAISVPAAGPRVASNTAALTFGPLTGANGTVAVPYWVLMSAASGTAGDVVAYGDFISPRTPTVSQSLTVAIGAITITLD
jgi:hypothetical protein